MKTLLTVIVITILSHTARTQECNSYIPIIFCSDVTFKKGNPLPVRADNPKIKEIVFYDCSIPSIPSGTFTNFPNVEVLSLHVEASTIQPGAFKGITNLKSLNLRHNTFQKIETAALNELPGLESLDLAYNKLTAINPGTLNLSNLSFLDLSSNQLTVITPGSLNALTNLKYLNLTFNLIKEIQPGTFKSLINLRELNLNHNWLRKLDGYSFENLKSLEYLHLGNCFLKTTVLKTDTFKDLSKLTRLNLEHDSLKTLDPAMFENVPNLQYLQLNHNELTFIPVDILNLCVKLKVLLIHNNKITSHAMESVVIRLPNLEEISLDNNIFECDPLPTIFALFENAGVAITNNNTKTYPNVYGITCTCNSDPGGSPDPHTILKPHIRIKGCKTNERGDTSMVNTKNSGSGKGNASETSEKAGELHPTTEETVVVTQNVTPHLENTEKPYEHPSSEVDTFTVITIVISVIVCILLISVVAFYVHRRKKLAILRNYRIKYKDVDLMSDGNDT